MTIRTHRIHQNYTLQPHVVRAGNICSSSNICALIADQLGVDIERVTDQSHFTNDLRVDWLKRLELVIFVEEAAGIELLDDEVDQIEFVGDLIRYVAKAEEKKGPTCATTR